MTEVAILQSDTLLVTVARAMNLANNADFFDVKGPIPHVILDDPAIRQKTVQRCRRTCT